MSSKIRRHILHKDQTKSWRKKRDHRSTSWAQRKARSKEYCSSTLNR